jgi:uncharacterized protein YjbI with pentapeptide repeats
MGLIRDSALIRLLRDEKIDEFNVEAAKGCPDLTNADLRMVDLRRARLQKANLRGAYLRNADLRGVDLSEADLHGASVHDAQIGGCLFPNDLGADEVMLSIQWGTRMRMRGRITREGVVQ